MFACICMYARIYIYMPYDQHARHTTTDLPEQGTRPQTEVALAADCFSIKSIHQATKHMVKLIHRLPVGTEAAGLGYNAPNCDDLGLGTSKNEPHQTKSAKRNIGSRPCLSCFAGSKQCACSDQPSLALSIPDLWL